MLAALPNPDALGIEDGCFMSYTKLTFSIQVLADLRLLAGFNKDGDEDDDEDEAALLEKEASMPIAELLAKMKKVMCIR